MSTTVDQSRQYAEFDEYINFQLHRLRAGIRMNDVFTALCGVAVIATVYLLAFVVLDHWVIPGGFSHTTRLVSMLLLAVGTLAWISLRVVRPCLRRVNRLYAAQLAESASEELDSNLLNYEDLRRSGRDVPAPILRALEKRAAVSLSHSDVDDAVDRRLLLRLSVALLTVVLIFCLYTVFSPKKVWPSIWRAINPVTTTQVATQTEIIDVQPGNKDDVLARTLLEVTVDLRGEVPDAVELVYSTFDRSLVDERVPLRRIDETIKRYACVLAGPDGDGLLQGLTYYIEAGDSVSPPYRIDVIQPPSVSVEQIHFAFPDYMEQRPERRESPDIDTWEGAWLTFSASTNLPVQRAWIEFSDTEAFPLNPEPLPMEIEDGTRLSAEWQAMIRDDGRTPRFYRIRCRTADGASDPSPAVYPIEIHPDEKPQIEAVYPTGDIDRPANAIVPLLLRAADPDFRLSRLTLRSRHGSVELGDRELWRGSDRSAEVEHDLHLAELELQPGDVLTWWGEARDNRVIDSASRRLRDNNVSITPQLRIRISAPVSEEEVEKQQEFDEQQKQEQLDELQQDSSASDESVADGSSSESPGADDRPDGERQPADATESESGGEQKAKDSESGDGESASDSGQGESGDSEGKGTKSDGTSLSDEEQSRERDGAGGEKGTAASEQQDGQRGDGAEGRRPVSNDGSDDDQVLRELLKKQQAREQQSAADEAGKQGATEQPDETGPDASERQQSDEGDGQNGQSAKQKSGDSPAEDSASDEKGRSETADGMPQQSDDAADGQQNSGEPARNTESTQQSEGAGSSKGQQESGSKSEPDGNSGNENSDARGTDSPDRSTNGADDAQPGSAPDGAGSDKEPGADDAAESASPGTGSDKGDSTTQPDNGGSKSQPGGRSENAGEQGGRSGGSEPSDGSGKSGSGESSGSGRQGGGSKSGSGAESDSGGKGSGSGKQSGAGSESSQGGPDSRKSSDSSKADGTPGERNDGRKATGDDSAGGKPGDGESPAESSDGKGGDRPGDKGRGDSPAGERPEPNGKQQDGQPSRDQPAGDQKSDSAQSGSQKGSEGSGAGDGKPSGQQGGKPSGPGKGTGNTTSGQGQALENLGNRSGEGADTDRDQRNPAGSGEGAEDVAPTADPVNVEDRLKATNLVLKELQEDLARGKVDQELLDKLGWTEEDMARFAERLKNRLSEGQQPADPGEEARARQFREMLKSLDLDATSRERLDAFDQKQSTTDFSDLRERVPQKYRGAFEKYLEKLSRQKAASNR
ncbi:MAG: MSCRAMM family adhesin [Planctomycetota bacterium]|jgi:hypothetical protein